MNGYAIADLILTLVSLGIRAEAIRTELEAMKASGKTDEEVSVYLRQLAANAIDDVQQAVK